MAKPVENLLNFQVLYESPLVRVRDYCCRAACGGPAEEEQPDTDQVVLLRNGAFRKHFGRRSVTADANQAVFFSKHSNYRVSHPATGGDRGTILAPTPRVLRDIIRELNPAIDEHPERPFPFVTGPCAADIFWRHRQFVLRLEAAAVQPLEPLWADVTALQLIADVLVAAYDRHGLAPPARRSGTTAEHLERVEAAKTYLASSLSERLTLEDVARSVNASPFHLARIFQQQTGVPVHRYLTQLRLRAALEQIANGATDLTALALELGFSSHSHFTDVFRRNFGHPPSEIRRSLSQQKLREMSKNLKV